MSDSIAIATAFIAAHEGFRSEPYQDQKGIWTIGYGFTYMPDGSKVTANTPPISQQDAMERLEGMVKQVAASVSQMTTVPLTDNQLAALISFAFNEGTHALRISNLMAMINKNDFAGAAKQFGAWVYCDGKMDQGLVNRRREEAKMFMSSQSGSGSLPPVPARVVPSAPASGSGQLTADDLNAAELNRVEQS
jgi:lysozyme